MTGFDRRFMAADMKMKVFLVDQQDLSDATVIARPDKAR